MTFEFSNVERRPQNVERAAEGNRTKGVGWYAVAGLVSAGCAFLGVGSALGVVALAGWQLFNWTWLGGWVWWAWSGLGAMVLAGWYGWDWTRRFAEREWELEDRAYALQDVRREVVEERVLVELAGPSVIKFALMHLINARLLRGETATTREVFVAEMKGQGFNADDAWGKANKVLILWGLKKPAPGRGWASVSEDELRGGLLEIGELEIHTAGKMAVWKDRIVRFDEE